MELPLKSCYEDKKGNRFWFFFEEEFKISLKQLNKEMKLNWKYSIF